MDEMNFSWIILAGGESRRMGQPKQTLPWKDGTLLDAAVEKAKQAGAGEVLISANRAYPPYRCVMDRVPGAGPLGGIHACLLQTSGPLCLVVPVDVPLFTAQTVRALMNSGARLACPECQGQQGHPILIAQDLIPEILADCGREGLRGALERCSGEIIPIPVDDPGTLHDADTPADFSALVDYHNAQLVRPVVSISLCKEKVFFGSKTATLLSLVEETSSVRLAGQRMQLSYSSCWNLIRTLESQLNCTIVARSQGGAGGSTSVLTPEGKRLLERYDRYALRLREAAEELFPTFFPEGLV